MRKILMGASSLLLLAAFVAGCSRDAHQETISTTVSADEKALITAAGFDGNWVDKTTDGKFLIEGDILLSKEQLIEFGGVAPANNLVVAQDEHYRTTNVVSTPGSGFRTITVRLSSGFPAYYSTGLDNALARYNSYNLKIRFQRVSTGGNIVISAQNLGTAPGGGCYLGQSMGFPTNGNPAPGFVLSNSSCALSYTNTATKADEVMAHEIGHCIGFRHTDYINRASCGGGSEGGAGSVGAVHIPGTPTTVSGTYDSWMMACTNGSASFNSADGVALNYVY